MTVEIIADGVHLPKSLLQFVYKFKGSDKTALCTDSMRGAGMPDGESILGSLEKGQKVIIEDGQPLQLPCNIRFTTPSS